MFLRNLNLFLPCFSLLSTVLGTMLSGFTYIFFIKFFPQAANPYLVPLTSYLLIAIALIIVWWRIGLSPSTIIPEREKRFKKGHLLVAIANCISITTAALVLLMALKYATFGSLPFLLMPFALFVIVAWIVGLIMIWSSRANA
ncbi:MAG: hypothetical protein BVN35_13820 [Proteobacteria bacterium ST_bin11]|nr:MAG: hypothetical protein BVN35_13820 [Proteobacteria bacterium ST_bin11]